MYNHEIDYNKINQAGTDIQKLVNEANEIIVNLKNRISNIKLQTKEWQGSAAEKFAAIFLSDIVEYEKAMKTISSIVFQLNRDATRYQEIISRVVI